MILLSPIILYFLISIITSIISVNREQTNQNGEITAYLETNGVHTTIVFPAENELINWFEFVDPSYTLSKENDPEYISFGWGDLEFYRNTPEWKDLSLHTAFVALFQDSPSAMHVIFFQEMAEDEKTITIHLTTQQYLKLEKFIKESFDTDKDGNIKAIPNLHYNRNDAFFRATGSFNLFYTCNTWTNDALKYANLRACLWTPFDKGIFYQYH